MVNWYLRMQWKKLLRSDQLEKEIFKTVLNFVLAIGLLTYALLVAHLIANFLPDINPDEQVSIVFGRYFVLYLFFDLFLRQLFKASFRMDIQSLVLLPINRNVLFHFALLKSAFGAYNIVSYIFLITLGVLLDLEFNDKLIWLSSICLAVPLNHFVSFLVVQLSVRKPLWSYAYFAFLLLIAVCAYFFKEPFFNFSQFIFVACFKYLLFAPLVLLAYYLAYKLMQQNFYLQEKNENQLSAFVPKSGFFARFGIAGALADLELKLILRHKRTRGLLLQSAFLLTYGLILTQGKSGNATMFCFMASFITTPFLFNYGLLLLAWEGHHFDFMLSKPISNKTILQAKYILLLSLSLISGAISLLYGLINFEFALINLAFFVFNIGLNIYFFMWLAVYNTQKVNLSKGVMMNYEGFKLMHYIVLFPVFLIPYGIYQLFFIYGGIYPACAALMLIGLIGLGLKPIIFKSLSKRLANYKYELAVAYRSN